MKFTNIFDKLKIVFDLVTSSDIFVILSMLIIAVLLLRLTNKINNKKMGIIICLMELITFGILFFINKNNMLTLGNKLIDNMFINFYFPSIYVYLFILITSIVIFIYTLLNRFISNTYKVITNIYFIILNFIFILLVDVIIKNNIDIFAKESLFTNNNALVLLELSTLIFFIYLVTNVLVYITNYIILLVENKKVSTTKVKDTNENKVNIEISIDREEESDKLAKEPLVSFNELVNRIENMPKVETKIELVPELNNITNYDKNLNIKTELVPELVVKSDYKFIDPMLFSNSLEKENTINKEELLFGNIDFIDYNSCTEEKITLNDYKLFSKMLKTIIENSNNSNLSLSDILNTSLLLNRYSAEEYNKFEKILNSCLN